MLYSVEMEIDVNRLARRPPGPKTIVYLDQSTISSLARDGEFAELRGYLLQEVEADRVICPMSQEHRDETLRARQDSWDAIDRLNDELAMGISFRATEEVEWAEIHAAAARFADEPGGPVWREAFDEDPHRLRAEIFDLNFLGADLRIRARFDPAEWQRREVEDERQVEDAMDDIYAELRDRGFSYEEMANGNVEQMLHWKLGPLLAPDEFRAHLARRYEALEAAAKASTSLAALEKPVSRMIAFGARKAQMTHLVERYPVLADRPDEFRASETLRSLPTLIYPALFRAALAATPARRARRSDGYDIAHLTLGLSRCDVVTADRGMAHVVRQFNLAPDGCRVVESRDREGLVAAIRDSSAAAVDSESARVQERG